MKPSWLRREFHLSGTEPCFGYPPLKATSIYEDSVVHVCSVRILEHVHVHVVVVGQSMMHVCVVSIHYQKACMYPFPPTSYNHGTIYGMAQR